jgi:serine/threonine-protein kinase
MIVTEGDRGDEAFIIVEGKCRVLKQAGDEPALLRELRAGDVFGETAVLSEKPRTASVEAMTDVTVMVVTRESMTAALGLNAWVGPFIKALADRFREVDGRLRELESTISQDE